MTGRNIYSDLTPTPTPTPTPTLTLSRNIYSGKAADMWAVSICIYMWLYHKPACNAPTQAREWPCTRRST